MAARFGGRLYDATFTKKTAGAYDTSNPSGPPSYAPIVYACKGIAFSYSVDFIDGERIKEGDYEVMILLGTIGLASDLATVKAELDAAAVTIYLDTIVQAVVAGTAGEAITVELVADGVAAAGSISEVGSAVSISFLPDASTVADIEALIATSTLVEVKTAGTGATVLTAGDAFGPTELGQVIPNTPTIIPHPGDSISVPPPAQTIAKVGAIVGTGAMSQAFVTVQVRGPSL
jgi:hypothetical protein